MSYFKRVRSSNLFLMELILSIFFFILTASLCVQVFAKAHTVSEDAKALNFAVTECGSAAELVTASGSTADFRGNFALLSDGEITETDDGCLAVYFDGEKAPCGPSDAVFCLICDISEKDSMLTAKIDFKELSGGEIIYSLTAEHYTGRGNSL